MLYFEFETVHKLDNLGACTHFFELDHSFSYSCASFCRILNTDQDYHLFVGSTRIYLLVWPRKYAHSSFNSMVHTLLPKDALLRTYLANMFNPLTVMGTTRSERRLISIRCQNECVKNKRDGQTYSDSDYSEHLRVMQNFDTKFLK